MNKPVTFHGFKYNWSLKQYEKYGRDYIKINIFKANTNILYRTFNIKGNINKLLETLNNFIDKENTFIRQLYLAHKFDMALFY